MKDEKSLYHYLKLFWQLKYNNLLIVLATAVFFTVGYIVYPKTYTITAEYYAENKDNSLNDAKEETAMVRLAGGYVFLGNSKPVQEEALKNSGLTRDNIRQIKMTQAQQATFFKMTISADTEGNARKFAKEFRQVLYARGVKAQRANEMRVLTNVDNASLEVSPKVHFLILLWLATSLALSSFYVLYIEFTTVKRRNGRVSSKRYPQRTT